MSLVREVKHAESSQTFKLGRKAPLVVGPRLRIENYLYRNLPAPPRWIDYTTKSYDWLGNVLANDTLGICTGAGAFHIGGMWLANAGEKITLTVQDVINFYSLTTGYVPGDESTDQGADELTVLNYWQQHGLTPRASDPHKIVGYARVNARDENEVATAIWLFESVYFGIMLPDAWLNNIRPGFVWDIEGEPNPNNGHCVVACCYNSKGVVVDSWGLFGTITWAAVAKYASQSANGELYTMLSDDSVDKAKGRAPNGFDRSQLIADLHAIR